MGENEDRQGGKNASASDISTGRDADSRFERNGESYRFRESVKAGKKTRAAGEAKTPDPKAASTTTV